MKKIILWLMALVWGGLSIAAQSFDFDKIASHPRLLLPEGGEKAIKNIINTDSKMAVIHQRILDVCDQTLKESPVEYIKEGKRLLAVSRMALKRIYYLSYAYRMTGDIKYARRAELEMRTVCRFTDWNPTHFLDVGEMVMAISIGYDWLYNVLQPETKLMVCDAVREKGFKAAENSKNAWFYTAKNNWNSVCNSGLVYGALALYEEMPQLSEKIISKCMQTNPKALVAYGPDGGYPEGYGYWGYGTSFQVMLIAALESALGTDNGLSKAPGFMESPYFMEFMAAPSGDCFCFSDCPVKEQCNTVMFWFAEKLNNLSLLWNDYRLVDAPDIYFEEDNRLLPSLLVFASKLDLKKITPPTSHFWSNRGDTPVFIYRGGWNSPTDTYLGVKGGSPSTSHAHMDAGSFVFERDGVRWATDLGIQSYITLESKGVDLWNMKQNSQRWDVFRLSNKAHNTLTINDARHLVNSFAPITHTYESSVKKGAEIDLTSTFKDQIEKVTRTVALDKKDFLHVTDVIRTTEKEAEVAWVMVTPAQPEIVGNNLIKLEKDGKQMLLEVNADQKVEMQVWSNTPPHAYDHPNPGTVRVGFKVVLPASKTSRLHVVLKPLKKQSSKK